MFVAIPATEDDASTIVMRATAAARVPMVLVESFTAQGSVCACIARACGGENTENSQLASCHVISSELMMRTSAEEPALYTCYGCRVVHPKDCNHLWVNYPCTSKPAVLEVARPYFQWYRQPQMRTAM